jgi:hypothetical protein
MILNMCANPAGDIGKPHLDFLAVGLDAMVKFGTAPQRYLSDFPKKYLPEGLHLCRLSCS